MHRVTGGEVVGVAARLPRRGCKCCQYAIQWARTEARTERVDEARTEARTERVDEARNEGVDE